MKQLPRTQKGPYRVTPVGEAKPPSIVYAIRILDLVTWNPHFERDFWSPVCQKELVVNRFLFIYPVTENQLTGATRFYSSSQIQKQNVTLHQNTHDTISRLKTQLSVKSTHSTTLDRIATISTNRPPTPVKKQVISNRYQRVHLPQVYTALHSTNKHHRGVASSL